MKFVLLSLLVVGMECMAHEGHTVPGAIPPAPNGGVLVEATHQHAGSHDHDHVVAAKRELFYEATFSDNSIKVFPLELDSKTNKSFLKLKLDEFSNVDIKVEDPREKKVVTSSFSSKGDNWVVDANSIKARRLIVNVSGIYKGAKYQSQLQVERK